MVTKEDIQQILEPINKKLDNLTSEISHIKTSIKYLATQEDTDLEVEKVGSEIFATVLALRVKVLQIHKKLMTTS